MGFNFHVPLPGPFSYTKRIGGNKRRHSTQDLARDAERRAAERAEAVRRAGVEQDELLGRIERARPLLAAETVASLDAEAARMVEMEPASVRWSYRAGKVRALLGDVDGQGGALERTTARLEEHTERTRARADERVADYQARGAAAQARAGERIASMREQRAATREAHRERRAAAEPVRAVVDRRTASKHAARRDGYAERIEVLRARGGDVAELDAGLAAMDAETGGSWAWNRRAEELRRALKRAER